MQQPPDRRHAVHHLTACRVGTHVIPAHLCCFGDQSGDERELFFYVWIVRSHDSVGLIDTGLPTGRDLAALRSTGTYRDVVGLDEVLRGNDVAAADIDWCAVTQPITYHSGGLLAEFLPRAEVYVAAAGVFEMLMSPPGHPPVDMYFTEASWMFLRNLAIERRLHLIEHEAEIAPGVVFETTGGHHPGSAALRVATEQGIVGILETAFLQQNIDEQQPIGIAEDMAECRAAIERYTRICDRVVAGHEPRNVDAYPGSVEG